MTTHGRRIAVFAAAGVVSGTLAMAGAHAQPAATPAPIRVTMDALHASGGVPRGWKFLMPAGDAGEGRKVFARMECFSCHDVKGEGFGDPKTARGAGPELTGMGSHHPAEYFAESIVNPNRVLVLGPGYTGADGLSKMPSYADTMTVQQLTDVVAYLRSLTGGGMGHAGHHEGGAMKHEGGAMKHEGGAMKMK